MVETDAERAARAEAGVGERAVRSTCARPRPSSVYNRSEPSDAYRRVRVRSGVSRCDRPDGRGVEPAWPAPVRAAEGAPNVLFIVLDDTGFGQSRLLRQPDRDAEPRRDRRGRAALQQHAHDGAVLAVSRSCIVTGPQPSRERDGVHHRARVGLSGLQRRDAVRERDAVGDAARARLQHVHGRQVASDAEQPGDGGRARTTAGRWAAASSASTASSAATRASGIRTSSTTTTRSSLRRSPRRATT